MSEFEITMLLWFALIGAIVGVIALFMWEVRKELRAAHDRHERAEQRAIDAAARDTKTSNALIELVFQQRQSDKRLEVIADHIVASVNEFKSLAGHIVAQGEGQKAHFEESRNGIVKVIEHTTAIKEILIAERVGPQAEQHRRKSDKKGGLIGGF